MHRDVFFVFLDILLYKKNKIYDHMQRGQEQVKVHRGGQALMQRCKVQIEHPETLLEMDSYVDKMIEIDLKSSPQSTGIGFRKEQVIQNKF